MGMGREKGGTGGEIDEGAFLYFVGVGSSWIGCWVSLFWGTICMVSYSEPVSSFMFFGLLLR